MSDAVFEERDGTFVPSGHARGPWDERALHGGGPAALLARAVEQLEAPGPMLLARLACEEPSPAQHAVAAADFGNGISSELHFEEHLFVNTDLTVHFSREPVGEWIAVEAVTDHGPEGTALAASALHDVDGPVGRAAQSLYVDTR